MHAYVLCSRQKYVLVVVVVVVDFSARTRRLFSLSTGIESLKSVDTRLGPLGLGGASVACNDTS